jgi:hypothetical protein
LSACGDGLDKPPNSQGAEPKLLDEVFHSTIIKTLQVQQRAGLSEHPEHMLRRTDSKRANGQLPLQFADTDSCGEYELGGRQRVYELYALRPCDALNVVDHDQRLDALEKVCQRAEVGQFADLEALVDRCGKLMGDTD